jgi:hypothetical protein
MQERPKLGWYDFKDGNALARVDGGPAGVYYCETVEQYEDAVYQIICFTNGTGLHKTTFEEIPDGYQTDQSNPD